MATPKIKIRKRDSHTHTLHSRYISTQESRHHELDVQKNSENFKIFLGGVHTRVRVFPIISLLRFEQNKWMEIWYNHVFNIL